AVSLLMSLDYVRPEGKAKPVAQRMPTRAACVAAAFGLPWLFWPDWRAGLAALAALALVRAWAARYFVKRIGGYTGDCLGFAQQLSELAIYLVVLGWMSS
ncbi:adenosylcobinamide-GDP ribazoletransferase, partial [Burkholderia pseudomultivorans]|uniref:adenosylcobinamide-GDP ribazoletransferase n=1 Tax=Burkholderia pseudomultivorans TaxID=1207504 RepID=UPI00287561FF